MACVSSPSTRRATSAVIRSRSTSDSRTSSPNSCLSKRATRSGVVARAPAKNGAPNTIGSSPRYSPGVSRTASRRMPSG